MLPLLTADQIRKTDAATIANEPVSSLDLMEQASKAFVDRFMQRYPEKNRGITIYCGTGNNGGDGLAIARLLDQYWYQPLTVVIARYGKKSSPDFDANFERLKSSGITYFEIQPGEDIPEDGNGLIIDALLGT